MQAPREVLKEMERCARSLARHVRYVGAATVEYLYTLADGGFFFLELNPRLQVRPETLLLIAHEHREIAAELCQRMSLVLSAHYNIRGVFSSIAFLALHLLHCLWL